MAAIAFAGQMTEDEFRRINALVGRKVWLVLGVLVVVVLGLYLATGGWRSLATQQDWDAFRALVASRLPRK